MPVGAEIPAGYTIICWFEIFFFSRHPSTASLHVDFCLGFCC